MGSHATPADAVTERRGPYFSLTKNRKQVPSCPPKARELSQGRPASYVWNYLFYFILFFIFTFRSSILDYLLSLVELQSPYIQQLGVASY